MKPYIRPDGRAVPAAAARVLSHYDLVDKGDLAAVIDLYAPDAVLPATGLRNLPRPERCRRLLLAAATDPTQ